MFVYKFADKKRILVVFLCPTQFYNERKSIPSPEVVHCIGKKLKYSQNFKTFELEDIEAIVLEVKDLLYGHIQ